MCVCDTEGVVASGREAPDDDLLRVDCFLAVDPVEDGGVLAVGRGGILARGRRVTSAGDFVDEGTDALHPETLLPDSQFSAVAVETSHDNDKGARFRGRCVGWQEEVDWDDVSDIVRRFVLVRDENFFDRVFHQAREY